MGIRQFWFSTVLITAACVLVLFFFPLPHGSFVSTHGPVTALRALQALYLLCLSVAGAARIVLLVRPATRSRKEPPGIPFAAPFPPLAFSCLRC